MVEVHEHKIEGPALNILDKHIIHLLTDLRDLEEVTFARSTKYYFVNLNRFVSFRDENTMHVI